MQNLINVLEDLIYNHKTSLENDFIDYLKFISDELSIYLMEIYDLMSEAESAAWIVEPMDFGSYYSSKNTSSETHKYELLQEAYTQAYAIQEHFDKGQEFPNHLKDSAHQIYEFVKKNEVYQMVKEYMNNN